MGRLDFAPYGCSGHDPRNDAMIRYHSIKLLYLYPVCPCATTLVEEKVARHRSSKQGRTAGGMEGEEVTVSKLEGEGEEVTLSKLATLEKVKERVEEDNQLSVIGGTSETGSPYLRVWGGRALAALNHTPLVEMVVVPEEEEEGVISCTLVSYRREPLHSATFVTADLDTRTGLPCFLDYLQTRLGQSYSLCSGFPEATLLTSLPGNQLTAATLNKCLVERQPNGGGTLLLRSRHCQSVRPAEVGEEERCPACVQLFHSVLPSPTQSSGLADQPEPEQSKSCPFEACSQTFRREKPYQRHLKSHAQVKCDNCHMVFASESQLDTHMRKAHKEKSFDKKRDICDPVGTLDLLPDEDENIESSRTATEPKSRQFSCGQCGAVYQYKKAFQKHFQTHRDDGGKDILNCDQCSHICQTEEQLKEHKAKKHTHFDCDQCDSVSSSSKALEKHKRKMHAKAQDQCHLCGKNVKRTSMTNHVKMVHQAEEMRRHICNVCGNKYKTKTDLDRHYTKHTGCSVLLFVDMDI